MSGVKINVKNAVVTRFPTTACVPDSSPPQLSILQSQVSQIRKKSAASPSKSICLR